MTTKYYIILNKQAASGHAGEVWPEIEASLAQANVAYDMVQTEYAGHALLLAEQFARHNQPIDDTTQVVMAVGGDGTLHEVLNGILNAQMPEDLPIAFLPIGSGNDFARGYGMPTNWCDALTAILATEAPQLVTIGQYTDIIKNEHSYFTNNVGIGLDAAIIAASNRSPRKHRFNRFGMGRFTYVASAIGALYNQQGFQLTVSTDHNRDLYAKAYLVTVSNHPYFGGGVKILPPASMDDEQLDLIVIEKRNAVTLLYLIVRLLFGRLLTSKAVHLYHDKKIHLGVSSIEFGQVDGEEMGGRYFDIFFKTRQYPFWINRTSEKSA